MLITIINLNIFGNIHNTDMYIADQENIDSTSVICCFELVILTAKLCLMKQSLSQPEIR